MPSLFEKQKLTIECIDCRHKITETAGRLQKNPIFTCPKCGLAFDADELSRTLKKAEREFERLGKTIRDFGRK